jgi:hypothetical protein
LKAILIYIIIGLSFYSCKKDEYELDYESKDIAYFGSHIGSYYIYEVKEIVYDDFQNSIDTFNYQIKEYNESEFYDNLNRKATRIERFRRNNDTSIWQYLNTWYSVASRTMVERVENNIRFVKLSFPVSVDAVWNANSFNMDVDNNVYYGLMHQTYRLNNQHYDSAISVEGNTIKTIFRERAFKEIYAKNIGLVYKNFVHIDKAGLLQKGVRLSYELLHYEP